MWIFQLLALCHKRGSLEISHVNPGNAELMLRILVIKAEQRTCSVGTTQNRPDLCLRENIFEQAYERKRLRLSARFGILLSAWLDAGIVKSRTVR